MGQGVLCGIPGEYSLSVIVMVSLQRPALNSLFAQGTMVFLIFAYGAGAQLVLGTNPSLVTSPKSDPAGEL